MPNAKAAVFDLGNVLLEWHPEAFYDAKIGEARRRAFFAEVPIEDMNMRSDLGEDLSTLTRDLAAAHPAWADEIMIWWNNWLDICAPAIGGSVDILAQLKSRGVPVFSLTNFGVETLNIAKREYPFLNTFDHEFVSGALRVMKPDPAIYEAVERGTGLAGADLIFADDKPENIEAARARGWQVHLFEGPDGWEQALKQSGLL